MPGILITLWRLLLGEVSVELVREEKGEGEYEPRNDDAEENIAHFLGSLRDTNLTAEELQIKRESRA